MAGPRTRFGAFEFEAGTGELWREGRRVRLQRQPSRLLELLVARPGDVVSREEIRQALWGDDTHVDFERSLNFCVAKLRSALRDNAASPRFVETVPTRGYRFIAPVEAARHARQATAPRRPRVSRDHAAPSAATAVVAVGRGRGGRAVSWSVRRPSGSASRLRPLPKIVVVPFHNETGSSDLDRLAKGVSDADRRAAGDARAAAASAGHRQRLRPHLQLQAGEHEGDGGVARRAVPAARADEERRHAACASSPT